MAPDGNLVNSLVNNISFLAPPSPLLHQGPDIPQELYCPLGSDGFPQCPARSISTDGYCECVHVIKVKLGSIVQIVLGDESEYQQSWLLVHSRFIQAVVVIIILLLLLLLLVELLFSSKVVSHNGDII